MTIQVNKYTVSGFSAEDAQAITPVINESLTKSQNLEIDYEGVSFFTTFFFNQSLTYLIGQMGLESYNQRIVVKNLSESGQSTYKHAYDYAIEYYKQPKEKRAVQDTIIGEEIDNI